MYEAHATVIGTIVTEPNRRQLSTGEQVLSFRMASNARRFDANAGAWVDNGSLYLTVFCWRRLVDGVGLSLHRGDPVLVCGQLRTIEYRGKDGGDRRDLEMRAVAVGPDLTRCTAEITRNSDVARNGHSPSAHGLRNISGRASADSRVEQTAVEGGAEAGDGSAVAFISATDSVAARSPVDA
ncbi:single-stranded DNA-binding protein [Nocardia camponoti]|uniref:Single-stranded DNA-binding protein n=1 Tax=Nocardia camponoti TaxID=1616106 RepID=A0A917QRA4_9NOCA|nr:single-stranded DNA-binding protein [Nocardia camponoti]GGK64534.1 hypothetical protein GCM10011591_40910 [Nocardia camponoti]